jgi:arginyl-tRNA synthetase
MYARFVAEAEEALRRVLAPLEIERPILWEEPRGPYGDLSTPLAFDLAPLLRKAPKAIAEELVTEMAPPGGYIRDVKAEGGHINFYLDYPKFAVALLQEVLQRGEDYGRGTRGGRMVIEHTSANPDGPLHIGHGRNAVLGDTLARILAFSGHDVETQFYINDMGKQLAVVVWGLRSFPLDGAKKPDHAIAEVYVKANRLLQEREGAEGEISDLMRRYEAGEEGVRREFEEAAKHCLRGFEETLERLGITHDTWVWESTFVRDGSVEEILRRLRETGRTKEGEVLSLDLTEFGIEKELVLTRGDGTYLYTTRDIAYHLWKTARGKVLNVWGADHKLVSQQLKAALRLLGEKEPEFVIYEFITLPDGSMSTRKGVFISLDELIEESVRRARLEVEKRRSDMEEGERARIAAEVGVGAVRYNIVRIAPEKPLTFRWEEALDFERQGAPFLQYAYARACRILEKAEGPGGGSPGELTERERHLLLTLSKFPKAVEAAAEARKPSLLASYVLDLATSFHRFYMHDPVLGSEEEAFRLDLVRSVKVALGNALRLLGIAPLEQM